MKPACRVTLVAAAVAALGAPAAAQTHPIQIALVTPVQIVDESEAIAGFRWNILYGRNTSLVGLDIGLVNHLTSGQSKGAQGGLVGIIEEDFIGLQGNFVNVTNGSLYGMQSGIVNVSGVELLGLQEGLVNSLNRGEGVQAGLVNVAQSFNGLQFGLVNYAANLEGIQIGLVNIIARGGVLPVMPIVNWAF